MGNEKYLLQGLTVHPYYTMLRSKSPTMVYVSRSRQLLGLEKDAKIAVLLPLPSETSPQIYWTQPILDQRPLAVIYIRVIAFWGLRDTEADQRVIPQSLWPKHWGTKGGTTLKGIGGPQLAKVSSEVLLWEDEEGNSGTFQYFIITGLKLCSWGEDIMQQLRMTHHAQSSTFGGGSFPSWTR
jgi:hypothetical protein